MKLERVVLGIDFSDASQAAARWVASVFAPDAELTLVHVVDIPRGPSFLAHLVSPHDERVEAERARAEEKLAGLGEALGAGTIRGEVRVGRAAEELNAAASELEADLIVVGPHGRGRGLWGFPGSTALRTVHRATTPVLVAGGYGGSPPRSILVPVDDSPLAVPVLEWGQALADRFGASLVALHVLTLVLHAHLHLVSGRDKAVEIEQEARTEARGWLEDRTRDAGADPAAVTVEIVSGHPGFEILAAARRHDADLIVMGSRGSGAVGRELLGSVASAVLRSASCPVLVEVSRSRA